MTGSAPLTVDDFANFGAGIPIPGSIRRLEQIDLAVARMEDGGRQLLLAARSDEALSGFAGEGRELGAGRRGLVASLDAANLDRLRSVAPELRPVVPPKEGASFGGGCRMNGTATRGHAQALARTPGIHGVYAQQSVRENTRIGRTARSVHDDTLANLLEVGFAGTFTADADHNKTLEDAATYHAAGYTLFTCDPGDHVDDRADTATATELEELLDDVPWPGLEITRGDYLRSYEQKVTLPALDGAQELNISAEDARRAVVKYGRAIAHAASMYRHVAGLAGAGAFAFEASVDETENPTSPAEHYIFASLLKHLGVELWSLAPRFVGRFEKGIDFVGNVDQFRTDFALQAAVAHLFGYKVSIHSGSDKLSVYPLIAEQTRCDVHVKTAGTSYLIALETVALEAPDLFREVFEFGYGLWEEARATYHVSAEPAAVPPREGMRDEELRLLLWQRDARQILHVAFGHILREFSDRLWPVLRAHERVHDDLMLAHIYRHVRPFA